MAERQEQLLTEDDGPRRKKGDRHEMKVADGTTLKVAVSALIKELRRSNELEAYYWARQIEDPYHKYLWRRLLIFASEDVNLGDVQAVVIVRALYDNYETVRTGSKNPVVDRSIVAMAVLVLARANKSREADDLLNVYENAVHRLGWKAEVPDYAYDQHTPEGRRLGRKVVHWVYEASKVIPRVGPMDWWAWMARWYAAGGHLDRDAIERYVDQLDQEDRLKWGRAGYPGAPDPYDHPRNVRATDAPDEAVWRDENRAGWWVVKSFTEPDVIYRVQPVDAVCDCPSRQNPCKHVLKVRAFVRSGA